MSHSGTHLKNCFDLSGLKRAFRYTKLFWSTRFWPPFWFGTIRPGCEYSMMWIINICLYICVVSFFRIVYKHIQVLWLVGGRSPFAESMYFYSINTNTNENGEARQKSLNVMYENYIIYVIFLHYVTFTFFNVYVLETLCLVTQNVWWCYMKSDLNVLKILLLVQFTLCATTFSNITSCDVNVMLRYVM